MRQSGLLDRVTKDLEKIIRPKRRQMKKSVDDMIRTFIPDQLNRMSVPEWAEKKVILPRALTPIPGPFSWSNAPYFREVSDCLSESSPIQKIVVMKGSRVGATVSIGDPWLGYIIDCAPGPTMFISADKGSTETQVEIRLDRLIVNAGLQDKIFAQTEKAHNKKTGDTKSKKEFPGGFLLALGPNVASKLRSFGVRYIFFDEVDAYKMEIKSEGDPIALAEKRTNEYERIRKLLYLSTPTIKQTSRIEPLFLAGDRRYYHVPCKHCGEMQRLVWKNEEGEYRLRFEVNEEGALKFDTDKHGQPIPHTGHVWYECEKCGGHWVESDKINFMEKGKWIPTAIPREPNYRSYHISALYSMTTSWEQICKEFLQAKDEPAKLRVWINTALGETWVEKGEAPRPDIIRNRAEFYEINSLPANARPLVVTIGADVQDNRIEAEVVAWGRGAESWSIEYFRFYCDDGDGGTANPESKAWSEFMNCVYAKHAGLLATKILIDEGGGHEGRTTIVRSFCEKFDYQKVQPVKGASFTWINSKENVSVFRRRISLGFSVETIALNVDLMKETIYNHLNRGTASGQPPEKPFDGYCHFPKEYDKNHYDELASEERYIDYTPAGDRVVRWRQIYIRNHVLDCRSYALGALYVVFDEAKKEYKAEKGKDAEYGWPDFWIQAEQIAKMRSGELKK